jgi:hypothetical protein
MALSKFAGRFNASEFAYGVSKTTPALQVIGGPNATGSGTLTLAFGGFALSDGTMVNAPLNTNASITVGGNSNIETVTPTAVSNSTPLIYGSSSLTASFTYLHGNGDSIRSGTCGLQEALNFVGSYGGGVVVIDYGWVTLGGTQAMIEAAVIPANVDIEDLRYGMPDDSGTTVTLTNAQILNMATITVELLPAPNANQYWRVVNADLVNLNTGTAYTGGSAITIGYGSTTPTNALSGTIAASFLTTPTATEVIQVPGGLLAATAGTAVLGKGIYIGNATTAFAAGTGTLQVTINAALITT